MHERIETSNGWKFCIMELSYFELIYYSNFNLPMSYLEKRDIYSLWWLEKGMVESNLSFIKL